MKKENNVSYSDFLDFEVFAVPDKNSALLNTKNLAQKEILVLYFNEKNDDELELLLKNILSAANLDFENNIAFLKTTSQQKYSSSDLLAKLSVKDLLFFGINPSKLGINYSINPYQPLTVKNRRFLQVDSLEEIKNDVNKKKALWSCLKEMYLQNEKA
jgi:DNA polymerase III psi subunit